MLKELNISEYLFWDTDINSLDKEKHARFIIGRVIMRGTLEDWKTIKKVYGLSRIKSEMLSIRHLDKVSLSFLSAYFNTPKNKFRCYIQSQSQPQHWDY